MTQARGIDVSAWQGLDVQWAEVAAAGYSFAFLKATEGLGYRDATFARNWQATRDAGVLRGAYHFLHAQMPARGQAGVFLEALLRAGTLPDLPCVVDVEIAGTLKAAQVTDCVCEWIDIVHQATSVRPIVYTYAAFSRSSLVGERLAECPLWIAHYEVDAPVHSPAWKRWDFWQTSGRGSVPGVHGKCDTNVYNGTLAELCEAYGVTR